MSLQSGKQDSIELVVYNPEWPFLAAQEMQKLRELLPDAHIIDIQHVGSTAVPGIMSKPILDIQIAVDSLHAIKETAIATLTAVDYIFWPDNPDTERMFFVKGMPPFGKKRSHHVHICEYTSRHWRNKIFFRDYLKQYPEMAAEYEALKLKLEKQCRYDREKYTEAKTAFVGRILELSSAQAIPPSA